MGEGRLEGLIMREVVEVVVLGVGIEESRRAGEV